MEFKYKKFWQSVFGGIFIILTAAFVTALFMFLLIHSRSSVGTESFEWYLALVLTTLLFGFLVYVGYYTITVHKRVYVQLSEDRLWISNSPLNKISIPLTDIQSARILGIQLIFSFSGKHKQKEIAINLSVLYVSDTEKLIEALRSRNISIERI